MTVRIQGPLEWTDLLKSRYLHVRPRRSFAIAGVVLLLLFVWALYETASNWMGGQGSWHFQLLFAGVLLYLAAYFVLLIPISAYRIFKQQKSLNLPFSIEASSEAFCAFNEQGRAAMPWSHFVKWKKDKELFLLYHSDNLFNLVPKRFFQNDDEVREFRSSSPMCAVSPKRLVDVLLGAPG